MTVLVDARNVLRSQWPNVDEEELVELCRGWAQAHGHRVLLVFDGDAPEGAASEECDVVATGRETADEWIERAAAEWRARREPYWLVTSDRALREAARHGAERVVGGGAFLRELQSERRRA